MSVILFLILTGIHYLIIEFPLRNGNIFKIQHIKGTLTGYSVIVFLDSFLCLVFGFPGITLIVLTLLYIIFGIVNYFVYTYHGAPFTMGELKNIRTAMAVSKSYTFTVPFRIILEMILFLSAAVAEKVIFGYDGFSRMKALVLFIVFGIIVYLTCFSPKPLLNKKLLLLSWSTVLEKYGYIPAFVLQTVCEIRGLIEKPHFYSREDTVSFITEYQKKEDRSERRPDIILIVNETFYDLQDAIDLKTDEDVLSGFRNIEGSIRGRTVTPGIGGGTNASEFECLTSNSMKMMPYVVTPFNVIDMNRMNSSLTYLKSLGYRTFATHPGETYSYRRNIAYPAMGFDRVAFRNDYMEPEYYGRRTSYITDSSMYRNLIRWYEETPDDEPRFFYGLTIQNHGDWISNTDDLSLVRVGEDFGAYTRMFREFLSCIRLSDKAFSELVSYFKDSDRDVVIAMAGDHSPSFVKDKGFHDLGGKDDLLTLGSTPYIIWSNRGLKEPEKMDIISMPFLMPAVFESAGMHLSPWYEFLNELRKEIPVLKDPDETGLLQKDRDLLKRYYSLEYLNYSEADAAKGFWTCASTF